MKLRERPSTATAIDEWLKAAEAEFGLGNATASLRRLAPVARTLLDSPDEVRGQLVDYGYSLAQDNHELTIALRALELLANSSRAVTDSDLHSRSAAVHVTNGWTEGVLNRADPVSEWLTPLPFFTLLVEQRYAIGEQHEMPASQQVVLVVVDVQDLIGHRLELARVRSSIVRHLHEVFNAGQPVGEGTNGNLVTLVERGPMLLDDVAKVRDAIQLDAALAAHPIRLWIEPLSDDAIHLESHLSGLLGDSLR